MQMVSIQRIKLTKCYILKAALLLKCIGDEEGVWKMDTTSKYARRITGLTPFELTGPAKGSKQLVGQYCTRNICELFRWTNIMEYCVSAEENYEDTVEAAGLNETHYGWIVEVDPFNANFTLRKHTASWSFPP